jgi:hypothetical protein
MTSIRIPILLKLMLLAVLALIMSHQTTDAATTAEARVPVTMYKDHASTTRARTMEFLAFNEGALGYVPAH